MTTPAEARERANQALVKASEIRERGDTIAEKWRQSREDNNFRQMLRAMGKGIANNAST